MHPTGYDNTTNIDSVKVYNKIEEFLLKMFFTCTQSYKFMPASFTERRAEKKNADEIHHDSSTILWSWKRQ